MEPTSPTPERPTVPETSLWTRLFNVFAAPGDVFAEVKAAPPRAANWLVPTTLFLLVGILSMVLAFRNPEIFQQVREAQARALDQKVQAGKITQAKADEATKVLEKILTPSVMAAVGSVTWLFFSFIRVIWWGFVLLLLARF